MAFRADCKALFYARLVYVATAQTVATAHENVKITPKINYFKNYLKIEYYKLNF